MGMQGAPGPQGGVGPAGDPTAVTYLTGGSLDANIPGGTQALGPGNAIIGYGQGVPKFAASNSVPMPQGTATILSVQLSGIAGAAGNGYGFTLCQNDTCDGKKVTLDVTGGISSGVTNAALSVDYLAAQNLLVTVAPIKVPANVAVGWSLRYEVPPTQK